MKNIRVEELTVGALDVNCYIVGCDLEKVAVVIDPGADVENIIAVVKKNNWTVKMILNTHAHPDHTGANKALKDKTDAAIFMHKDDLDLLNDPYMLEMIRYFNLEPSPTPDQFVTDNQSISFSNSEAFKVIHTPGHSPGGVCFLIGDHLFTGDTLFRLSIGRTDLSRGNYPTLIDSIKNKLLTLPEQVIVYPGHGERSTIKDERNLNPFLVG
ncbi:MAG: MBL fold metallo-hydrolase [Nitrospinota bacterium]